MKTLNNYINEWKINDASLKDIKQKKQVFIYKLSKPQRIRIFGERWNLLEAYKDKVYINGEKVVFCHLADKHGVTKDTYDPGEYEVYIKDIDKVDNHYRMFNYCTQLVEVPLFDMSNSTTLVAMFQGCSNLKVVPKFDAKTICDIAFLFNRCRSLVDVPLFNLPKVKPYSSDTWYCFDECKKLSEKTKREWSKIYNFDD